MLKIEKIYITIIFFWFSVAMCAAQPATFSIEQLDVSLLSDGTKIGATVFMPKGSSKKLPAIAMAHGWGGEANHLFRYAKKFAANGYFVLVFDYRGWGKSDSRLVQTKNVSTGKYETIEYKGLIDPLDQAEDYFAAVNWLATDERVDPDKIGLWGTSWSGGTVVYVAARDSRIKALVSQASPVGWAGSWAESADYWLTLGGERARSIRAYPKPFKKEIGSLRGGMVYEKLARFNPREDAALLTDCAALFLVAENEELFDNTTTSLVAHERVPGISRYVVLEGASHYSVYYGKHATQATNEALTWFGEHLK